MPWRLEALMSAVLAHGTDPDSVLHRQAADLDGSEELWYRLARRLLVQSCSWRWDLSWCEVWQVVCCLVHRSGFVDAILKGRDRSQTGHDWV